MPKFEEYERSAGSRWRKRHGPSVTIQRRGSLSFSTDAMEMLANPEALVFLVDQDARLVGFRKAPRTTRNARAVTSPFVGTYTVSARALCTFLNLDLSEARRYPLVGVDGIPCVDLKQPGTIVTSNRAGTGAQS